MRPVFRFAVLCAVLCMLDACATITRSPHTNWTISSSPLGAEVLTSQGAGCPQTPCTLNIKRSDRFTATVSMPGYESQTVDVHPMVASEGALAFLGNGLIGGLIGASIDIYTGSALDPSPNGKVVMLAPDMMMGTTVCTQERMAYARQVGVPCEALGEKVYLRADGGLIPSARQ